MGPGTQLRESVLVVEDSPLMQGAMKMILEWEGYRVSCAANGREALDRLRDERPGLILLDLHMPVMDGWQLRDELKQDPDLAAIPIITVSGMVNADSFDGAGCVHKPFEPEELLAVIRQARQVCC